MDSHVSNDNGEVDQLLAAVSVLLKNLILVLLKQLVHSSALIVDVVDRRVIKVLLLARAGVTEVVDLFELHVNVGQDVDEAGWGTRQVQTRILKTFHNLKKNLLLKLSSTQQLLVIHIK